MLYRLGLAADHHAVAALQAPDAAAGADIDVVDALGAPVPWRGGCHRHNTNCRRRSGCRRAPDAAADRRWFRRPPPAGTISQTARGFVSFLTNRPARRRRRPFPSTSSSTAFADMSKTDAFMAASASAGAPYSRPSGRGRSFPVACISSSRNRCFIGSRRLARVDAPPSATALLENIDELAIAPARSRRRPLRGSSSWRASRPAGPRKLVRPTAKSDEARHARRDGQPFAELSRRFRRGRG